MPLGPRQPMTVDEARKKIAEIDQPHLRRQCGAFTLRGVAQDGSEARFYRLNCKCWDCRRCGPRRAARYKYAIREIAQERKLTRFLTLTLDPKKVDSDKPVHYLRECWNMFRVYLRRKFGEAPQFIAVLEFQKNGMPHLHVITDRFIEQTWIKSTWEQIGGGMHVDIRSVDLHRVSNYLSKYPTKELLMSAPKRSRRITCSRGIRLNEKRPKKHNWALLKCPIKQIFSFVCGQATQIQVDTEGELQTFVLLNSDGEIYWSPDSRLLPEANAKNEGRHNGH